MGGQLVHLVWKMVSKLMLINVSGKTLFSFLTLAHDVMKWAETTTSIIASLLNGQIQGHFSQLIM